MSFGKQIFGTETEFGLLPAPGIAGIGKFDFARIFNPEALEKLTFNSIAHPPGPTGRDSVVMLRNGGRFHLDNLGSIEDGEAEATPEYASPETCSTLDLVRWEKAGEIVVKEILDLKKNKDLFSLVKNNRGLDIANPVQESTCGHHENYSIPFTEPLFTKMFLREDCSSSHGHKLITFLVSRILLNGSGWFSQTACDPLYPFQISQRADFISDSFSGSTTVKRGIVCIARTGSANSHADRETQRMHLILGDSNMSELSLYLTIGTTALVLRMLVESNLLDDTPYLLEPSVDLKVFSRDPWLKTKVGLRNQIPTSHSLSASALELQDFFCLKAKEFVAKFPASQEEKNVADYWEDVLLRLSEDIRLLNGELDWVTKLCLMESYLKKKNSSWRDVLDGKKIRVQTGKGREKLVSLASRCSGLDMAYHHITEDGLYQKLAKAGRVKRLLTDQEIVAAAINPPQNTRAKARTDILEWLERRNFKYQRSSTWESITSFFGEKTGHTVHLKNPFDFTCKEWQDLKAFLNL